MLATPAGRRRTACLVPSKNSHDDPASARRRGHGALRAVDRRARRNRTWWTNHRHPSVDDGVRSPASPISWREGPCWHFVLRHSFVCVCPPPFPTDARPPRASHATACVLLACGLTRLAPRFVRMLATHGTPRARGSHIRTRTHTHARQASNQPPDTHTHAKSKSSHVHGGAQAVD